MFSLLCSHLFMSYLILRIAIPSAGNKVDFKLGQRAQCGTTGKALSQGPCTCMSKMNVLPLVLRRYSQYGPV